jgi:hypothetical protein
VITDRGIGVVRHLPDLRRIQMCWQRHVSDAGAAALANCDRLESVNLMGTPTGDGLIRALAGKSRLAQPKTGRGSHRQRARSVNELPVFKMWQDGEVSYCLMSADCKPAHLVKRCAALLQSRCFAC